MAQKAIGVFLCPTKLCERTLQPVRRLAMGPGADQMEQSVWLVSKHLFAQVSSSAVHFGVFVLLDLWQVSYGQILTGKMKIVPQWARVTKCS